MRGRNFLFIGITCCWGRDPKLWPLPSSSVFSEDTCTVHSDFQFVLIGTTLAQTAYDRVLSRAVSRANDDAGSLLSFVTPDVGSCSLLVCHVIADNSANAWVAAAESESYSIVWDGGFRTCEIRCAYSVLGCMHGLTTFLQMIDPVSGFAIPRNIQITDAPQFVHRGLLIDTGRRFLPVSVIMTNIDAMAATKMNVLHWHIVDDHSFPYQSLVYPDLSGKGAYSQSAIYTQRDIQKLVQYANDRGIQLVPEFDMPGHASSWFEGHPELRGIAAYAIDPSREENYTFISNLLAEVANVFKSHLFGGDKFKIHLGGDETWDGWDTREMAKWMVSRNMYSKGDLAKYWLGRLSGIAQSLSLDVTLWQDFLGDTNDVATDYTWQMWYKGWDDTVNLSLRNPNASILWSSNWYLDHLELQWEDMYGSYLRDNTNGGILGGEACMWGESVDEMNFMTRVWPRTSAVAERLWSNPSTSSSAAASRLAKWVCRTRTFGNIPVANIGRTYADNPDREWTWHTEFEQWYCEELDLIPQ